MSTNEDIQKWQITITFHLYNKLDLWFNRVQVLMKGSANRYVTGHVIQGSSSSY